VSRALARLLFPEEAETSPSWEVLDTGTTDPELHREDATVTQINVHWRCAGGSVSGKEGDRDNVWARRGSWPERG